MQQWCVKHILPHMDKWPCDLTVLRARRLSTCVLSAFSRRSYATCLSSSPSETYGHNVNCCHSTILPTEANREVKTSSSSSSSSPSNVWDLQYLLFALKDHQTTVVTCVDMEERLRSMKLLDEWMKKKLFKDSGWLHHLQENGETAPHYRNVVGVKKILRYLLHKFISNEYLWRDELENLMTLILGDMNGARHKFIHQEGIRNKSSIPLGTSEGNFRETDYDNILSTVVPDTLYKGPEKMNFYSYGLQDVLWKFLHAKKSSFEDINFIWHMFVAFHRNLVSLPSPQRPPFSCYELLPILTEAEFAEMEYIGLSDETGELLEKATHNVTPHRKDQWTSHNDVQTECSVEKSDDGDKPSLNVVDERRRVYARDEFYMNIVEPEEVTFWYCKDRSSAVPLCALASGNTQEKKQKQRERREESNNDVLCTSKRVERTILNPVNGELEDIHLTHLWDVFKQLRQEDIIDMYRSVCGNLEKIQEEVFIDIVARRGLLMLFFACDEVRAITPPFVTYSRLVSLHQELIKLSTWTSSLVCDKPLPPPSFNKLAPSSQLSFSCFAQLHAPIQRDLYTLPTPTASPAHLYHSYCERYLNCTMKSESYLQKDDEEEMLDKSPALRSMCDFPTFECLSELQQMAFQYPFEDNNNNDYGSSHFRVGDTGAFFLEDIFAHIEKNYTQTIHSEAQAPAVKRRGRQKSTDVWL